MPATTKRYTAREESDATPFAQREDDAIANFLEKTDRLLSIVVAALVIWVALLIFNGHARAAPVQALQMHHTGVQSSSAERICQPGMAYITTRGLATTSS